MRAERAACVAAVVLCLYAVPAIAQTPAIVDAAKRRDATAVRALLARKADVKAANGDGTTALHWAAHWGDAETAQALLKAGANVNAATTFEITPLMLACTSGDIRMVELLLTAGANPNTASRRSGDTALLRAVRSGKEDVVAALLRRDADVYAAEAVHGQDALMFAAGAGYAGVAQLLIDYGASAYARSRTGFTPLLFAAREGHLDVTKVLLDAGADINEPAKDGTTALIASIVRGHDKYAEFLLDHGADPNGMTAGYNALHWVAGTWETILSGSLGVTADSEWGALAGYRGARKLQLVKTLLAHGANPNARMTKNPPTFGAEYGGRCRPGCEKSFGLDLLSSANNITRPSLVGATPLLLAAEASDIAVMRLLLEAGADPSITTEDKTTLLMQAAGISWVGGQSSVKEEDALAAVRLAFELAGGAGTANKYGDTAIHGASRAGWSSIIRFLVEKGAGVNVKNGWGESPLIIADGRGRRLAGENLVHKDVAVLLRTLGASE